MASLNPGGEANKSLVYKLHVHYGLMQFPFLVDSYVAGFHVQVRGSLIHLGNDCDMSRGCLWTGAK